jgi:hypothetical protein
MMPLTSSSVAVVVVVQKCAVTTAMVLDSDWNTASIRRHVRHSLTVQDRNYRRIDDPRRTDLRRCRHWREHSRPAAVPTRLRDCHLVNREMVSTRTKYNSNHIRQQIPEKVPEIVEY